MLEIRRHDTIQWDCKPLPELTVSYKNISYSNSCVIDLGVLAPGQKLVDKNLRLSNTGNGNLTWTINMTTVPAWLKITPSNGTIAVRK